MALAIYELDAIGLDGALEANGRVHFYCSHACLETGRSDFNNQTIATGSDDNWVDGTVCESCGDELREIEPEPDFTPAASRG